MILRILLILALCGSGAFGFAFFNRKFEELLPIYYLSIAFALFAFGLLNVLNTGWWIVMATILAAYIASIVKVLCTIKREGWREALDCLKKYFFTPELIVFLLLLLILMYCNGGVMLTEWDEFTHWGLIVKQMTEYNALSFNTVFEGTLFRSYPPGVALFQYFGQKYSVISGDGYREWLNYLFLQVMAYSFFVPFFKGMNLRKAGSWACRAVAFLCPLAIFSNALSNLGVDFLLGIASAAGLAYLYTETDDNDVMLRNITVLLDIAFLSLIKDAGMLFAAILAIAFALRNKRWLAPLLCVSIPKMLWLFLLTINNVPKSFGDEVDLKTLFNLIFGRDSSYKLGVWKNYWQTLFSAEGAQVLGVGIPLLVVLILTITLVLYFGKSRQLTMLCAFQAGVFFFGLALVYAFKFSEYEAGNLASFQRYIKIIVNQFWILTILLVICRVKDNCLSGKAPAMPGLVLCITLSLCSIGSLKDFLFKDNMYFSEQLRSPLDGVFELVDSQIEDGSSIYFISPESTGFEYFVAIYDLYKHPFNSYEESWSIVVNKTTGNQWSREVSAEQWQKELKDSYDYVLLFDAPDSFVKTYSNIFEDESAVASGCLYKVNKETGRLQICPIGY